jgi:hypothetical protein
LHGVLSNQKNKIWGYHSIQKICIDFKSAKKNCGCPLGVDFFEEEKKMGRII